MAKSDKSKMIGKGASIPDEPGLSNSSKTSTSISEEKLSRSLEIIYWNSSVKAKETYKALTYIRTKVVDKPEGVKLLQKLHGYKHLLALLFSDSSDEILNITISILGNLCNLLIKNEDFRREILASKVSFHLAAILRKSTSPDVVRRLCRFIGNLSQSHAIARDLSVAGVIYPIVNIINNFENPEVLHMAIRALRWLWEADKFRVDMRKAEAVKSVANRLKTEDPVVLNAVLRALVKFTQNCNATISEEICGRNGDGYVEIVSKLDSPVVPVLICNLSYEPRARIELCKAGAVEAIIQRLESGKTNSYLITGLSQMCKESMVRASIRNIPNGFKTIFALLMNKNTKHFYPDILDAVTQFNFDQASLMLMVKCGLIGVLIEKLGEHTKSHCTGHSEAVRSDPVGTVTPLSPASSYAASPSPPPCAVTDTNDCQSNSSTLYSPRCSSPASDSSSSPIPLPERSSYYESPTGLDGCILDVLTRLTYQGIPMRALSDQTTISTLLDYLAGLPYPRYRCNFIKAEKALKSIVACKLYWNTLLDDESVLNIHARLCRPVHENCWECRRLKDAGNSVLEEIGRTAQCGLGEGEMTYRLMGTSSARLTTALTIPHVIRSGNLLKTLLFNHSGLRCIIDGLDTRIDEAVPSLHSLFSTLKIQHPQKPIQMCSSCEIGSIRKENTIVFVLDDGSSVSANKESLSHACPVFEAMFRGGFKESLQSSVRLIDISPECLTHIIKVLPEYCSCALPKDLSILLEMVAATDRFLLPDLTKKIVTVIRDSALTHTSAAEIYDFGLITGNQYEVCSKLSTDVVKFIFVNEMLEWQRIYAVSRILESGNKFRFLDDIVTLVQEGLTAFISNESRIFNYNKDYDKRLTLF